MKKKIDSSRAQKSFTPKGTPNQNPLVSSLLKKDNKHNQLHTTSSTNNIGVSLESTRPKNTEYLSGSSHNSASKKNNLVSKYLKSSGSIENTNNEYLLKDDDSFRISYRDTDLESTSPLYHARSDYRSESSNIDFKTMDLKLIQKELAMTKKSYNESQAKSISLTKELSKVQHENNMLQIQLKKADLKSKELLEKHSSEQAKINELSYINNQLNNEIAKLKAETHDNSFKTKENLDKLKKTLSDVEILVEGKYNGIIKCVKKSKLILYSIQKYIQAQNEELSLNCQENFEKLEVIINKILETISAKKILDLKDIDYFEDYDGLKSVNDMIDNYQKENHQLKDKVSDLIKQLQKEQSKSRELIPQYRESVNRLRSNTNLMRERLKELQEIKQIEAKEMNQKVQITIKILRKSEMINKSLLEENRTLKTMNNELNSSLKDYETLLAQKDEKIREITQENKSQENRIKKHEETLRSLELKVNSMTKLTPLIKPNEPEQEEEEGVEEEEDRSHYHRHYLNRNDNENRPYVRHIGHSSSHDMSDNYSTKAKNSQNVLNTSKNGLKTNLFHTDSELNEIKNPSGVKTASVPNDLNFNFANKSPKHNSSETHQSPTSKSSIFFAKKPYLSEKKSFQHEKSLELPPKSSKGISSSTRNHHNHNNNGETDERTFLEYLNSVAFKAKNNAKGYESESVSSSTNKKLGYNMKNSKDIIDLEESNVNMSKEELNNNNNNNVESVRSKSRDQIMRNNSMNQKQFKFNEDIELDNLDKKMNTQRQSYKESQLKNEILDLEEEIKQMQETIMMEFTT